MEKRLQTELREVVEAKKREGFEVVQREPHIVMQRGPVKIRVGYVGSSVIVRAA